MGQIEVDGQSITPACHFVASGQEAIDVCKERLDNGKALYKLIFMDIGLGDGKADGLEITKQIRQDHIKKLKPQPVIVALSAKDTT